jgi:hypothetical protein
MRKRSAFTLVEMMVAMALVIFIMLLLTQAFVAGLETFRQLKAIGDMDERMRAVTTVLRADLAANHFSGDLHLSDPSFSNANFTPPDAGFFRIWQGSASTLEGTDGDGLPSFSAANHFLHFTVRKPSTNNQQDYFVTDISSDPTAYTPPPPAHKGWALSPSLGPPDSRYQYTNLAANSSTFTSQWAEVAYFTQANGDSANGAPLFSVYRRSRLAVVPNAEANFAQNFTYARPATVLTFPALSLAYAEMSLSQTTTPYLHFNDARDLTIPERRLGGGNATQNGGPAGMLLRVDPITGSLVYPTLAQRYPLGTFPTATYLEGADLLVTDVISLDIQIYAPEALLFDSTINPQDFNDLPAQGQNTVFANGKVRVYDTWSKATDTSYDYSGWKTPGTATSVPLPMQILALKITLRVWDKRTENTRQVTMIQAM